MCEMRLDNKSGKEAGGKWGHSPMFEWGSEMLTLYYRKLASRSEQADRKSMSQKSQWENVHVIQIGREMKAKAK